MGFFKKLLGTVLTAYAKLVFKKAVRIAEEKYEKEHRIQFIFSPYRQDLVVVNSDEFRQYKYARNIKGKEFSAKELRNGCWYHTKEGDGSCELSPSEVEVRRLAFIKHELAKSNL